MIILRKLLGLIICSIAVLLPWRARVLYNEALGWTAQFFYYNYYCILSFILKELGSDNKDK